MLPRHFTEQQLKDTIVCDADLWASCIGGAAQQEAYLQAIEAAGFTPVSYTHLTLPTTPYV